MLILSLRLLTITFFTTLFFLTSCCFTALANIPTVLIAWAGLSKLPFEGIFFVICLCVIFLFFYLYRYILFILCCLCVILFLFCGYNNTNLYSFSKNIYMVYVYMIHISIYCLMENRFNCNYSLSIKIIQHYLRNIYDVSRTIVVLTWDHSFYQLPMPFFTISSN